MNSELTDDPGSMSLRELAADLILRDLTRIVLSGHSDPDKPPKWIAVVATGDDAAALSAFFQQMDAPHTAAEGSPL